MICSGSYTGRADLRLSLFRGTGFSAIQWECITKSPALWLFQFLLHVSDYRVREFVGEAIEFDNVLHGA